MHTLWGSLAIWVVLIEYYKEYIVTTYPDPTSSAKIRTPPYKMVAGSGWWVQYRTYSIIMPYA